jgi:hypothetical protein
MGHIDHINKALYQAQMSNSAYLKYSPKLDVYQDQSKVEEWSKKERIKNNRIVKFLKVRIYRKKKELLSVKIDLLIKEIIIKNIFKVFIQKLTHRLNTNGVYVNVKIRQFLKKVLKADDDSWGKRRTFNIYANEYKSQNQIAKCLI